MIMLMQWIKQKEGNYKTGAKRLDPDVGNSSITGTLTFVDIKARQDVPRFKEYFNDILPKIIKNLVFDIEGYIPNKVEGSDELDKLFYNKVS